MSDPQTALARVTVVSSAQDRATVVDDVLADADQGRTYDVHVLDNDLSPFPDSPLTLVSAVAASGEGEAVVDGDVVRVTPAADFVGTMLVVYTVGDRTEDPDRQVEGRLSVTVRGRPEAPSTPTVVEVRSHTAVISWSPPANNGAEITTYTVQIAGGDGGSVDCPTTTCTLTDLTNATDYTFAVTATNVVGTSDASPRSATIRPDEVPDPPSTPTLTFGDEQVHVAWTNTDYAGERSAISSVTLEISPPPTSGATQMVGVTGTVLDWDRPGERHGLPGACPGGQRGRALGVGGLLRPGDPGRIPTAGKPTTLMLETVVGGQAQMQVSWAAPVEDNGDAVSGYTLVIHHGSDAPRSLQVGAVLSQVVTVDVSEASLHVRRDRDEQGGRLRSRTGVGGAPGRHPAGTGDGADRDCAR